MKVYLDVSCLNRPFDAQGQARIRLEAIWERAARLTELGLKPADAAHVAAAESGGADVFFTCDDKLLKAARRNRMLLTVRVVNPLDWIREDRNGAHA